jgi:hypothetical protein
MSFEKNNNYELSIGELFELIKDKEYLELWLYGTNYPPARPYTSAHTCT